MGIFVAAVGLIAVVLGLVLHVFAHTSWSLLLGIGAGALCLLWLLMLVTVPWNLYFQARKVLAEISASRDAGIEVPEAREREARRLRRRLLRAAVAAHLVSAAVAAVVTVVSGRQLGYWFTGFYLLSLGLRPADAYFRHVRARLGQMLQETTHPREDVQALKARLDAAEARLSWLGDEADRQRLRLDEHAEATRLREDRLEALLHETGRRFEGAIGALTDNQEVITGIRAFLRLLREDRA